MTSDYMARVREKVHSPARPRPNGRPRAAADVGQVRELPNDPHRLARVFLADHRHADGLTLRFWRGEFHGWAAGAYRPVADDELRARLTAVIKAEFDRLNREAIAAWAAGGRVGEMPTALPVGRTLVNNVCQALAGECLLPDATEPPAWLAGGGPPAAELLACRNGLLHLAALADGRPDCLLPLTPRFFSTVALDYDFDPHAPPPVNWCGFLDQLWPSDPQSIQALQEWAGYLLTADTSLQKILLLVGPPRSGKGTIARVKRALVGAANVAGPTLGSLGGPFGLQPLLGKSVAIISDARLSGRTDSAIVTERLLSISGEDALTVDRKHKGSVTGKLPTRLVILTNELPRVTDTSGALANRFIILRMSESFLGREDPHLTDRLLGELPGILLWAVEGWRRLRQRGHFEQPDAGRELLQDLEDIASPVGAFVRECCVIHPAESVPVVELFNDWARWCGENGRRETGTVQTFGRDLRAVAPAVSCGRPRTEGGRIRLFRGIGLRPRDEIPD